MSPITTKQKKEEVGGYDYERHGTSSSKEWAHFSTSTQPNQPEALATNDNQHLYPTKQYFQSAQFQVPVSEPAEFPDISYEHFANIESGSYFSSNSGSAQLASNGDALGKLFEKYRGIQPS